MVAAAIVAGSLSAVLVGPAPGAAPPPPPNPKPLWEAYPLDPEVPKAPKATTPAPKEQPPVAPRPTPAPPAAPPAASEDVGSGAWPFALGGAALVLALVVGTFVARWRRRRPTVPPRPVPVPALTGGETSAELVAHAQALAKEAAAWDTYVHRQTEGTGDMTETADHEASTETPAPGAATSGTYADIGERVAGVLSAAEAAANQIREDARAEAEEILSAARRDAEDVRREAAAYDTDTRAAVDAFASERRREAEQEVQKQLADSESQARATRQAAEAMARQIEEAGRQRGQALREESKAVEERLRKALAGFRRVTTELEELVGAPAAPAEALTDALKPQPRAEEAPPPLSVVPSDEP
jgi:cell division septum initiation protein DivIVA